MGHLMRIIEVIAQWLFAIFMSILSYFLSVFLFALIIAKLGGVPIGGQLPPDFHFQVNETIFGILVACTMYCPLIIASIVGAVTVPNSQQRFASIAFPVIVFLSINIFYYIGGTNGNLG